MLKLKLIVIILLCSGILMVAACRPEPVASAEPKLLVLDPSAEANLYSTDINIRTYIENFNLVEKIGQNPASGEGHIVYYLDVTPPLTKGNSALTQEGSYVASTQKSYIWHNVTPGSHNLWVQLVNNDDSCLEPAAAVRVPINVILK
jgi:hypothetical protein